MNEWLPNRAEQKHTAFAGAVFQLTISFHKKSIFGYKYCCQYFYFTLVSLKQTTYTCFLSEPWFIGVRKERTLVVTYQCFATRSLHLIQIHKVPFGITVQCTKPWLIHSSPFRFILTPSATFLLCKNVVLYCLFITETDGHIKTLFVVR